MSSHDWCQEECHEDGKSASLAFRERSADLRGLRGNLQSADMVGRKIAEHQAKMETLSEAPEIPEDLASVALEGQSSDAEDDDLEFTELAAAGLPCSSKASGPKERATKDANKDLKGKARPSRGKATAKARAASLGGDLSQTEQTASEGGSPGRRRRKASEAKDNYFSGPGAKPEAVVPGLPAATAKPSFVKKAREMYDSKTESISDSLLWQGKVKKRTMEQAVQSMETHAGKLLGDESQRGLMDSMLEFVEWAPKKFTLLSNLRKNPGGYVDDLSDEDKACLMQLDASLLATIVLSTASNLAKDVDQDAS